MPTAAKVRLLKTGELRLSTSRPRVVVVRHFARDFLDIDRVQPGRIQNMSGRGSPGQRSGQLLRGGIGRLHPHLGP